jgi:hypothetical protein
VWINPPAKKMTAQDPLGSTIIISHDLWVDPIYDADDHSAIMLIYRGATLRASHEPANSRVDEGAEAA